MTRSRIGPLALEAPLGDSNGSLFRAIHVNQKMQVAVRIFSTPMGMTPEAKRSFAEQIESAKSLKHPGIVRCFGGGFDAHDAYLVFELVDGESLTQMFQRRERLPWEMVLEYGLQLSNALQEAHEKEWIHGRISPDKILVNKEGTIVKLADFRKITPFERALPTSQRLDELAFRAPEALVASYQWQPAADLYSLGAVLYRALTGQFPFAAKSLNELNKSIIEQVVPPVSSIVFDCPVWLSTIVEQLLDKNPHKRPFTAAATAKALKTARDNALSGVSVTQHMLGGFSALQMKSDRSDAEKALGIKKKKQKKVRESDGTSFTDRPWFLVGGLALAIAAIYMFTRPLSDATLRKRAEALMSQTDLELHYEARDRYLHQIVERFPDGPNTAWAKEQLDLVDMEEAERRIELNDRFNRKPNTEGERKYVEAQRFERFGDSITALERYRAIAELMKDIPSERPFVNLSLKQVARLEKESRSTREVKKFLTEKLREADQQFEKGDVEASNEIWRSIVKLYNGNQEMTELVNQAQERLE
jgi:eukaryotic-like serine/threonine-protein kinase